MRPNDFGKSAIVTGSSGGIGLAVARVLRRDGYCVILNGRRKEQLAIAVRSLRKESARARPEPWVEGVAGDLTQLGTCERIWEAIKRRGIPLTAAFINTPTPAVKQPASLKEKDWAYAIRGLVRFPDEAIRRAADSMAGAGGGSIVVNASCFARIPGDLDFYLAGVLRTVSVSQAKAYARHYANRGIRVNVLLTGYVDTTLTRRAARTMAAPSQTKPDELWTSWEQTIPMRRFGRPEEVAQVAAFLFSGASSYMTGAVLEVDGGLSLMHYNF